MEPRRQQHTIKSVEGRGTHGSAKGLPPAARMSVHGPTGTSVVSLPPLPGDRWPGRVRAIVDPLLEPISPCAICLQDEATAREHVPQSGLGGKVMTFTCATCNNRFGSRVERDLQDYYDRALVNVRVQVSSLPGERRAPRLLLRSLTDGTPVLLFDAGRFDSDLAEAMSRIGTSEFKLTHGLPDPAAIKIAALKHAYLGSCLAMRQVVDTPRSRAVRAELIAARDTPRDQPLVLGPIAQNLAVRITGMDPMDQSILIVDWLGPNDAVLTDVLLAGTVAVSWPLEPELLGLVDERAAIRDEAIDNARAAAQQAAQPHSDHLGT